MSKDARDLTGYDCLSEGDTKVPYLEVSDQGGESKTPASVVHSSLEGSNMQLPEPLRTASSSHQPSLEPFIHSTTKHGNALIPSRSILVQNFDPWELKQLAWRTKAPPLSWTSRHIPHYFFCGQLSQYSGTGFSKLGKEGNAALFTS